MITRGAGVVRAIAHGERGFGGNENRAAAAGDRLAENFFRRALRIDVGGVKEIDSGIKADVHQAGGFLNIAVAPGLEEFAATAECPGAEAENRNS